MEFQPGNYGVNSGSTTLGDTSRVDRLATYLRSKIYGDLAILLPPLSV